MEQGWRCYYIPDTSILTRGNKLQTLAIRNLIQVQVYEDKPFVFVKDIRDENE